jgi:hypothetical protein
MHLCACLSEEGGDGEGADSEHHLCCHTLLDTARAKDKTYI